MSQDAPVNETSASAAPAPEAAPAAAPIKYELKAPDGYELPEARLGEIADYARERGLPPEVAQEFVNREHGALETYKTAEKERYTKVQQQWVDELKNDKTYGGENFNRTTELARRALSRFGTETLREALDRTGLGNHKELIITFAKIGEQMAEDTLITRNSSAPAIKPKSVEELFYGNKEN